jgi:RNA polymerase sigma-70 factor (ECF subfamily)
MLGSGLGAPIRRTARRARISTFAGAGASNDCEPSTEPRNRVTEADEPLEQHALIDGALRGDVRAFEQIYRALAPRVYGLCLRLARDVAEAEDCTQETFIRAWRRLGDFRGDSHLGTWLHRIAVNEVLGRRRRRAMESRHLTAVDGGKRYVTNDAATEQDLERAIAKLPERARDVFVLRAIYGYSHEEIAEMLEVAVSTSKSQHFRARKLLVSALPGLAPGADDELAADPDAAAQDYAE